MSKKDYYNAYRSLIVSKDGKGSPPRLEKKVREESKGGKGAYCKHPSGVRCNNKKLTTPVTNPAVIIAANSTPIVPSVGLPYLSFLAPSSALFQPSIPLLLPPQPITQLVTQNIKKGEKTGKTAKGAGERREKKSKI